MKGTPELQLESLYTRVRVGPLCCLQALGFSCHRRYLHYQVPVYHNSQGSHHIVGVTREKGFEWEASVSLLTSSRGRLLVRVVVLGLILPKSRILARVLSPQPTLAETSSLRRARRYARAAGCFLRRAGRRFLPPGTMARVVLFSPSGTTLP